MLTNGLKINVDRIRERIALSSARYEDSVGCKHNVTLVAATKTVPVDTINALVGCGVTDIGENRVQEYVAKYDGVQGANWHFIGTLQRNKVKYLVGKVALIQSVSSYALAQEIDRAASKLGVVQPVLIELNAAGESAKTGAMPDEIDKLIDTAKRLSNIEVRGLMAVPPIHADNGVYRYTKEVFDNHVDGKFKILSVGMSNDFEQAIMFGSNMVRIGTAIFGQRKTGVINHE